MRSKFKKESREKVGKVQPLARLHSCNLEFGTTTKKKEKESVIGTMIDREKFNQNPRMSLLEVEEPNVEHIKSLSRVIHMDGSNKKILNVGTGLCRIMLFSELLYNLYIT